METPIADFARAYAAAQTVRLHMPGHKGAAYLGCEPFDITEVQGADALYEAEGIIARSEENAAALFGTARTLFATEGSSQCIRAMLYLALKHRREGTAPLFVAARNVHKTFVHALALLDGQVQWLWPEAADSLCGCPISAEQLEQTLAELTAPPAAVYVTSPDYLGGMADIRALAEVCHRHGTILLVDNAHGAYLRFLRPSCHPMDLGADLCCDSAHKTLPVLTGGAYLHFSKAAAPAMAADAKEAMALFGSTSPSYLTLASLDLCNAALAGEYPQRIRAAAERLEGLRSSLSKQGWQLRPSDPLRLTLEAPAGITGHQLSERLRRGGVEGEYADDDFLVLMATPENREEDLQRLQALLGENTAPAKARTTLPLAKGEQVLSIRQAMFARHETVPAEQALGRICGAPTVSCPPAIPVAISGERIGEAALDLLRDYGIGSVSVVAE